MSVRVTALNANERRPETYVTRLVPDGHAFLVVWSHDYGREAEGEGTLLVQTLSRSHLGPIRQSLRPGAMGGRGAKAGSNVRTTGFHRMTERSLQTCGVSANRLHGFGHVHLPNGRDQPPAFSDHTALGAGAGMWQWDRMARRTDAPQSPAGRRHTGGSAAGPSSRTVDHTGGRG